MTFTKALIAEFISWQFIRSAALYTLLGISLAHGGMLATGYLFWVILIIVNLIELNSKYK